MPNETIWPYRVVDVFTQEALQGNALAVFTDAASMDAETMQRVAREMNLAETTFVMPATRDDCVARVRIFTPSKEMLFAGHPTIGTSFVLLDEGKVPAGIRRFQLEEKIGPVAVRAEEGARPMLWLETPAIEHGPSYDPATAAEVLGLGKKDVLGIPPQRLSAGNPTLYIGLRDKAAVDRAWIDLSGMKTLLGPDREPMCVFVFTPTPEGAYSRMFAPEYGIVEDPATGSSTGPLAAYMMQHGLVPNADGTRFVSEQGTKMGRRSLLHVLIRGRNGADAIEVGGHVTPVVTATLRLPR